MSGDSNGNTSWVNRVIMPAAAVILIAIVTPVGSIIKDWINKNFDQKTYSVFIYVKNAGQSLENTKVLMDIKKVDSTDRIGLVIFDNLKKGGHDFIIMFNTIPYRYKLYLNGDKDTIKLPPFDIASNIAKSPDIVGKTNLNTKSVIDTSRQFDKKIYPKVKIKKDDITILNTQPQQVLPVVIDNKITNSTPKELTANEILQSLQLKVKTDDSDKKNGQTAYHYYLDGQDDVLSKIVQVLYQRNHETFSEFQKKQFNQSDDQTTKFEFVGYQWGSISTTYVQIVLKDGRKSDVFLKSIIYVN